MAEKPKFDPSQPFSVVEDTKPKFDPSKPFEVASSQKEPETSLPEALKTGVFEGATLGYIDELAGGLEAAGQAVGLKGLGAPTLGEIETQSPKLSLDELMNAYQTARDRRRAITAKQSQDRPGAVALGNIVGGVGTAPLMPAVSTVKGAAALGGLTGLGMSEADLTKGDVAGAAQDTALNAVMGAGLAKVIPAAGKTLPAVGAATGAAIGGGASLLDDSASTDDVMRNTVTGGLIGLGAGTAAGLAGKAVKAGVNKFLPENIKTAYDLGKQGQRIGTKEFYDTIKGEVEETTGKLAKPIIEEKQKQAETALKAKELFESQKQKTIDSFEKDLAELTNKQKLLEENYMLTAQQNKAEGYTKLAQNKLELANAIDDNLNRLNKQNMEDLNDIYKQADQANVAVNSSPILEKFKEGLKTLGLELSPSQNELLNHYDGDISLSKIRSLKELVYTFTENEKTSAGRKYARDAYKELNDLAADTLMANPATQDLGNALVNNNKKAQALINFDETFGKFTEVEDAKSRSLNLLKQLEMAKKNVAQTEAEANALAKAKQFEQAVVPAMNKISPDLATAAQVSAEQNAATSQAVEAIPTKLKQNPLAPQMENLQSQLKKVKASKYIPEIKKANDIYANFSDDEKAVMNQIRPLLAKTEQQTGNFNAENQIKEIVNAYKAKHGDAAATDMFSKMENLANKIELAGIDNVIDDVPNGTSTYALVKAAKNILPTLANIVGKAQSNVNKTSTALISKPIDNLNSYIARVTGKTDNVSLTLQKMLDNVKNMPKEKQETAMFAIMQNPVYRQKLNQDDSNSNKK